MSDPNIAYVVYDNATGNVLFEGWCPPIDLPESPGVGQTMLTVPDRRPIAHRWKVVAGTRSEMLVVERDPLTDTSMPPVHWHPQTAPPGPPPGPPMTPPGFLSADPKPPR